MKKKKKNWIRRKEAGKCIRIRDEGNVAHAVKSLNVQSVQLILWNFKITIKNYVITYKDPIALNDLMHHWGTIVPKVCHFLAQDFCLMKNNFQNWSFCSKFDSALMLNLYLLFSVWWIAKLFWPETITVGRKIIRELEIIPVKKLVPNAVLWNKYLSSNDI